MDAPTSRDDIEDQARSEATAFFQRRLYYAPDFEILEDSILLGVLLLTNHDVPIGFFYRELMPAEARAAGGLADCEVVNGTLVEIDEAQRVGNLEFMYKTHLRHLSLTLSMTPSRKIDASSEKDARSKLVKMITRMSQK